MNFETLLAQLLGEPDLRDRFRSDREAVFEALEVPDDVRRSFETIDAEALDAQADSLVTKRLHEVADLLPRTFAALGHEAAPAFRSFAAEFWPTGHRRHPRDAWEFCRYLTRTRPDVVDAVERNRVRFLADNRWFAVHLVRSGGHLALQWLAHRRGRLHESVRRLW